MVLDATTQRNFELLESGRSNHRHRVDRLHRPHASAESAYLREIIDPSLKGASTNPLAGLIGRSAMRVYWRILREQLAVGVRDIDRRRRGSASGTGNARDLVVLKESLVGHAEIEGDIGQLLRGTSPSYRRSFPKSPKLPGFGADLIGRTIAQHYTTASVKGSQRTDRAATTRNWTNCSRQRSRAWIAALQQTEIKRTAVTSLKVRFDSRVPLLHGVTKANLEKVPTITSANNPLHARVRGDGAEDSRGRGTRERA